MTIKEMNRKRDQSLPKSRCIIFISMLREIRDTTVLAMHEIGMVLLVMWITVLDKMMKPF